MATVASDYHSWQESNTESKEKSSTTDTDLKIKMQATDQLKHPVSTNEHRRLSALIKPYIIWKLTLFVLTAILFLVDFTREHTMFSCLHELESAFTQASPPPPECKPNITPLGIAVGILAAQLITFVPKCPFPLVSTIRVLQMAGLLALKYLVQRYHKFGSNDASTGYFAMAIFSGLILVEVIVDNRGNTQKQKKITTIVLAIILTLILVAEAVINRYQDNILVTQFVIMFGPVGFFLFIFNCLLINCFKTALKHPLDPRYLAFIILSICLVYILLGISATIPIYQTLSVSGCGVISYASVWTAWCFTVPTPSPSLPLPLPTTRHQKKHLLATEVQLVRVQR